MKTEIQTLFARVKPGAINPLVQSIANVPDSDLEFYWKTVSVVGNTYEAKRQRTPDQRIVRSATSRYPGHIVDRQGRSLHVFEYPITPTNVIRANAIARIRQTI